MHRAGAASQLQWACLWIIGYQNARAVMHNMRAHNLAQNTIRIQAAVRGHKVRKIWTKKPEQSPDMPQQLEGFNSISRCLSGLAGPYALRLPETRELDDCQ